MYSKRSLDLFVFRCLPCLAPTELILRHFVSRQEKELKFCTQIVYIIDNLSLLDNLIVHSPFSSYTNSVDPQLTSGSVNELSLVKMFSSINNSLTLKLSC